LYEFCDILIYMKKIFFLLIVFFCVFCTAQNIKKHPFFTEDNGKQNEKSSVPEKIKLIRADSTSTSPLLYGNNPFLKGNVIIHHQGSVFKGREVIFYQNDNFIRAKGNIDITNPDKTHLTSDEVEYDGNTRRAIAKGNVILRDSEQTIYAEKLYYDREAETAYFNTDGKIILHKDNSIITSESATYYVKEKRVEFQGKTKVTNEKNPLNYVYTEKGDYLMNSNEAYLKKNSYILYNEKTLSGDDMYLNQDTGFGKATGNVKLDDPSEQRQILGGYGEIYEKADSAIVTQKPYMIKVLKTDSVYLAAKVIIAYQKMDSSELKKKSFIRAFPQARMFKTDAQGRSDSISYNETDGIMHFVGKPIFWEGERQVTGDSVKVYSSPDMQRIDSVKVINNAFTISKVDSLNMKDEFNQIKGREITIDFVNGKINTAKVKGNAEAITYADNTDEKNNTVERIGISYSTCGEIVAEFVSQGVESISCNIGALTDLYPMSQIPKEKRFFSDFNWNTRDRLQKWQDIFLDTPNYPEKQYISDDSLYLANQSILKQKVENAKPKEPIRKRKE